MQFNPLTEQEIQTAHLIPEGIYDYVVVYAKEEISRAQNQYIDMQIRVFSDKGERTVFTNLAFIKLLKHFCDVNNMQDKYLAGKVEDKDCINKSGGKVVIGIEPEKPREGGGTYRAKNIVMDYIPAASPSLAKILGDKPKDDFDSDIPF